MHAPLADVVWPALWLASRLAAVWAIGIGLVVELFFVRWLTGFGWGKAVLADVAMNAASSLVGVFLIPVAGLAWEFSAGIALYKVFNIGTFNPITWAATFAVAVFVNSALETTVLRYGFKQRPFSGSSGGFRWRMHSRLASPLPASFCIRPNHDQVGRHALRDSPEHPWRREAIDDAHQTS